MTIGGNKSKQTKSKRGGKGPSTPSRFSRNDDESFWDEPRENPGAGPDNSGDEEDSENESERRPAEIIPSSEIINPNRATQKNVKLSDLGSSGPVELSRREREEIERERKKAEFWKAQAEGKTDQARADLARLAIIRKQREEAAKKKAEEAAKAQVKASKAESLASSKSVISSRLGKK
ncbi:casein kinase substrate phosphoprotein PP28-domain-containing protein [Polychytrium aggregatum]|uniref:casein kinase substrate phosphoprotein PP28-domain-containing protein n=1 Tax=Polychytrium aggregatum TaxID=110093 RepID=UPI0022FE4E9B|nr:casein kinase substrate phosphoprotein PP28-domain-containing protein [Polychytrium aggregatum]KAI9206631.1 casein kinase substrate phosphoprotein PP28-domain-containing protein [Polychytrium aggregatum]